MLPKGKQKLVAFAVIGAVFGQGVEKLLRPVSTLTIIASAAVVVAALFYANRKRWRVAHIERETLSFEISTGILTAASTVVAHRLVNPLSRPGKLWVFVAVMGLVVVTLVLVNRKEKRDKALAAGGTARAIDTHAGQPGNPVGGSS